MRCVSALSRRSLRAASEGGDGAGDPAVREGQGGERGAARPPHSDLPGAGGKFDRRFLQLNL